jgi:hypothetical protein
MVRTQKKVREADSEISMASPTELESRVVFAGMRESSRGTVIPFLERVEFSTEKSGAG